MRCVLGQEGAYLLREREPVCLRVARCEEDVGALLADMLDDVSPIAISSPLTVQNETAFAAMSPSFLMILARRSAAVISAVNVNFQAPSISVPVSLLRTAMVLFLLAMAKKRAQ